LPFIASTQIVWTRLPLVDYYYDVFGCNELGSELENLELRAQFCCLDVLDIGVVNCCPILSAGPCEAT
jgi:hypothetical protein